MRKKGASSAMVSPLKPKPGLTPISWQAVPERSACAPFIKERRMDSINATSLRRKSGQWGTQPLVAGEGSSPLLVSQRLHGIDPHGACGRRITSQPRDSRHHTDGKQQGHRVIWTEPIELATHQARGG